MKTRDRLARRQLIVVTGKGGVGKTAMTAALGRCLARAGRRVLVLEVDPRENLHQLLDVPPSGGEVVEVGLRLFLQNLKPQAVIDWIVERQVPIRLLARRVLQSPIYQRFAEGAPGLEPMAVLGHALRMVRGDGSPPLPRFDAVVLDAPATGHGVSLLTSPGLLADTIGHGPIAELAREVADFVTDPEKCGVVVVTAAEEMPVQEALELRAALDERFGRPPELLIVNGLYPDLPPGLEEQPIAADPLLTLWHDRRRVNQRELERLRASWAGPRVELPLLPLPSGPRLAAALHDRLEGALDGLGEEPWS